METVLLVVHLMIVAALVGVVLVQRSEGGALGIGGGNNFLTSRGTGNVLTRTTTYLAIAFFVTSIGLTILAQLNGSSSILDNAPADANVIPAEVERPTVGGNILDLIRPQTEAPAAETPADAAPVGEATPAPAEATPAPVEATPAPAEIVPAPAEATPAPAEEATPAPAAEATPAAETPAAAPAAP